MSTGNIIVTNFAHTCWNILKLNSTTSYDYPHQHMIFVLRSKFPFKLNNTNVFVETHQWQGSYSSSRMYIKVKKPRK